VHCIIEAMLARSSDVILMKPQLVNVPQFMLGDSDRLRGILLNLYTNAAKFTRTGDLLPPPPPLALIAYLYSNGSQFLR